MRGKLVVILTLFAFPVFADSIDLSCTPPTQNTDGSPLTDLAGFRFYESDTAGGPYAQIAVEFNCALTIDRGPGTYYYVATAYDADGDESAYSNEVVKTIDAPEPDPTIPNAPTLSFDNIAPPSAIYSLPTTDFSGSPVVAGAFNANPDSLTIDFEITPRSFPTSDARIISKATSQAEQDHIFMVSMSNGAIRYRLKVGGTTHTLVGSALVPLGQLTTGSVTYDGQDMVITVNGSTDATLTVPGSISQSSAEVWVGGSPPNNAAPFDGEIAVTVS